MSKAQDEFSKGSDAGLAALQETTDEIMVRITSGYTADQAGIVILNDGDLAQVKGHIDDLLQYGPEAVEQVICIVVATGLGWGSPVFEHTHDQVGIYGFADTVRGSLDTMANANAEQGYYPPEHA